MLFEEFLKDLRLSKGLKQSELAELLYISEKTLSGYETNRRQCTFNFAMEILNKLNVSILVENNEIKLVKGDVIMNKNYTNHDLNFINFNTGDYIKNIQLNRKKNASSAKERFDKAYKKLSDLGFEIDFGVDFMEELWMDENYYSETRIASFTKDEKTIALTVLGCFSADMFVVEKFIEKIEENSNKEIADFILKCILYYHATHGYGRDIYDAFHKKDSLSIEDIIPMAENYMDIIINTLNEHYNDIFVRIENGFNPSEISIANDLEFYDCYETPNLYFVYTMDDGIEILDYEAFFEGHDVSDAFNYVDAYFEDYNSYQKSYLIETNQIEYDDDSIEDEHIREITIIN